MVYELVLSEVEKKRRIAYQNRCYQEHLRTGDTSVKPHGIKIVMPENVFAPSLIGNGICLLKPFLMEVKESAELPSPVQSTP
jgi:hypothetical protein